MNEPRGWSVLESQVLCRSPYLTVLEELVATPTRPAGRHWTRVLRKAGVVVAPRLTDGRYILIREERVPARRDFWQFPAGQVDEESTEAGLAASARRELEEEAGCRIGGELQHLGLFYTSPGFTDEHTHHFLASGVIWEPGRAAPDPHEMTLEIRAFTASELQGMIAANVIQDANTLTLFGRLCATGNWPGPPAC